MSLLPAMDILAPVTVTTSTMSRAQEQQELKKLNDRFASYIQAVRMLAERGNQIDSSSILKSMKAMEIEIHNLKNMYEQELEKLRKELEGCNHEKTSYQVQMNKHMQYGAELQDRLNVETGKNGKLMDEISDHKRRLGSLEAELQDLRIAASRPNADLQQLQRNLDGMTRDREAFKNRYEQEHGARQEAEGKIQLLMKKADFNDKVHHERVGELNSRVELSAATILSLEAKVRDLSKTDVSVAELLKQVRDTAEADLKKYQVESEEQYNRNLTALKAQIDGDAKAIEKLETERAQLRGSVGELQARIRSLEGQVANLEHQKQTLEDAVAMERNRAADGARSLERKLREVQDMLVMKMREVTTAREQNIPLKAEIEALKALLEEEEKRLKLSLTTSSSAVSASLSTDLPPALPSSLPPLPPVSIPSPRTTSSPRAGLRLALNTSATGASTVLDSAAYNLTTTATSAAGGAANVSFAPLPAPPTSYPAICAGSSNYTMLPSPSHAPTSPTVQNTVSYMAEARPYVPSPPLSVTYIPEALQTQHTGLTGTSVDAMFGLPRYEDELDPQLFGYSSSMPLPKYAYETGPGLNRVTVEPSPPTTPRQAGGRAQSAPEQRQTSSLVAPTDKRAERHNNLNLVRSDLGQGHDYFDKMFHDLQRDTLYSKERPKSSPQQSGRPLSSLYHDYTVSTSSAIGDLKICEVHPDGKYVRLVNEGAQEVEFGGFMVQQNVGGHPVAVYRFPPRTKFAPNSIITVYSGCNSAKLHKPPQDFVWKEQQKWGTGPECTTILCRANGQAVAWTTAGHRFARDAYQEGNSGPEIDAFRAAEEKQGDDIVDDDSLAEVNVNSNTLKSDPVCLRREKQQPPSLNVNRNVMYCSQDINATNQQSGVTTQKVGGTAVRKYVSGVSSQQPSTRRCNGKSQEGDAGEVSDVPSPFMKPHSRVQSGLDQVQAQHHPHFLPPMPRPPFFAV